VSAAKLAAFLSSPASYMPVLISVSPVGARR
jgi:hypothetical protein